MEPPQENDRPQTWRTWAGMQRTTARKQRAGDSGEGVEALLGGHGESLRRTCGDAAGEQLGTAPVDRDMVNMGTVPSRPLHRLARLVTGRPAVG